MSFQAPRQVLASYSCANVAAGNTWLCSTDINLLFKMMITLNLLNFLEAHQPIMINCAKLEQCQSLRWTEISWIHSIQMNFRKLCPVLTVLITDFWYWTQKEIERNVGIRVNPWTILKLSFYWVYSFIHSFWISLCNIIKFLIQWTSRQASMHSWMQHTNMPPITWKDKVLTKSFLRTLLPGENILVGLFLFFISSLPQGNGITPQKSQS